MLELLQVRQSEYSCGEVFSTDLMMKHELHTCDGQASPKGIREEPVMQLEQRRPTPRVQRSDGSSAGGTPAQ